MSALAVLARIACACSASLVVHYAVSYKASLPVPSSLIVLASFILICLVNGSLVCLFGGLLGLNNTRTATSADQCELADARQKDDTRTEKTTTDDVSRRKSWRDCDDRSSPVRFAAH